MGNVKNHDSIAANKAKRIKQSHLEALQKEGIVANSMTIADMETLLFHENF